MEVAKRTRVLSIVDSSFTEKSLELLLMARVKDIPKLTPTFPKIVDNRHSIGISMPSKERVPRAD
jgi:hypothetical protein